MNTISVERLGGLALIVGPILAFVMYLLQPGGLLINTVEPSDVNGASRPADNRILSNITVTLVCFGLVLMAFGLCVLQSTIGRAGGGDAVSKVGLMFMLIGLTAWFLAQGLALALAIGLEDDNVHFLTPLFFGRTALTIIGGLSISTGFFLLALGLSGASEAAKWVNWVIAVLALVSLGAFYYAASEAGDLDQGCESGAVPSTGMGRLAGLPRREGAEAGQRLRELVLLRTIGDAGQVVRRLPRRGIQHARHQGAPGTCVTSHRSRPTCQ